MPSEVLGNGDCVVTEKIDSFTSGMMWVDTLLLTYLGLQGPFLSEDEELRETKLDFLRCFVSDEFVRLLSAMVSTDPTLRPNMNEIRQVCLIRIRLFATAA
jgi:hypothetical protein